MNGQLSVGIQVGDIVVFLDPGLVVSVMGCKLDGGVVVDVVMRMPVT